MQNNVVGLSLINGKEEIVNGKGGCIAGPSNIQMTGISEAKETIFSSFPGAGYVIFLFFVFIVA